MRLFDTVDTNPFGPTYNAGVYAVCVRLGYTSDFRERIVYIGSSANIHKRLMNLNHPYRRCFDRFPLVYTKCIETTDYKNLEKKLIGIYKPLLNKQYK